MDNEFVLKVPIFPEHNPDSRIKDYSKEILRFIRALELHRKNIFEERKKHRENPDFKRFSNKMYFLNQHKANKMIEFIDFLDTIDEDITLIYRKPDKYQYFYRIDILLDGRYFMGYHFSDIRCEKLRDRVFDSHHLSVSKSTEKNKSGTIIRDSTHQIPKPYPKIDKPQIPDWIYDTLNLIKRENNVCV